MAHHASVLSETQEAATVQIPPNRFNHAEAVFITPNTADGLIVTKELNNLAIKLGFVSWPEEKSFAGLDMVVSAFSIETQNSDFEKAKNDFNHISKIEAAILVLEEAMVLGKLKVQGISSWKFI